MRLARPSRIAAALIALVSMLFMQLAVASYACPGMASNPNGMDLSAQVAANPVDHAMPGCKGMDMQQPSLCHAHDQVGNQSLDKPISPQVQPFLAIGLAVPVASAITTVLSSAPPPPSIVMAREIAPPISILNCCFRI